MRYNEFHLLGSKATSDTRDRALVARILTDITYAGGGTVATIAIAGRWSVPATTAGWSRGFEWANSQPS